MLDNETKRRIDSARDILVGKVPDPKSQVEQITIALVYKFMDDMDKESVEMGGKASFFVGNYERFAWTKIFDPRIGGFEVLGLYGEAIEAMKLNENLPKLFRDIFKNAYLPYRDPETLKLFLKTINEFHYDHSERLGDAFEYLLSVLGSQGDAGQFRTPRHIIDFMVEVMKPQKNETILDPACGTAGFLISSYKHILRANTDKQPGDQLTSDERKQLLNNFKGYDISPDMVRLSLVNLYLHGFVQPQVMEYDTLTSEDRWNEYADVILANPPFMSPKGGIKPHKRFSVESNRSEVLFVDYIAEHLTPTGRAAVIVPEGIIFQGAGAYKQLRKYLMDSGYLYGVVSLPAGIFNPYSGVKTSILLLDRQIAKKTDSILFVKVENDGFGLGAQRREQVGSDLPDALNVITEYQQAVRAESLDTFGAKEKACSALVVKKSQVGENGEYNLTGERYRVGVVREKQKWPFTTLGEVCEINPRKSEIKDLPEDTPVSFVPMEDLGQKRISFTPIRERPLGEVIKSYTYFQNKDVILARVTPCFENGKSGIAEDLKNGIGFGSSEYFVIRAGQSVLPEYIYRLISREQFMEVGAKQMTGTGGLQRVPIDYLLTYSIPLPPLEVQREIVAEIEGYQKLIDGALQVVESWKPLIEIDPDWPVVKLGDISDIVRGSSPRPAGDPKYYGGEIPRLMVADLTRDGMYVTPKIDFLTHEGAKLSRPMQKGELVMAVSGQPGTCAILNTDCCIHDGFAGFHKFDTARVSTEYMYFLLSHFKATHTNQSVGAVFLNLKTDQLREFDIPFPPLETQKAIVAKIVAERKIIDGCRELIALYEAKVKKAIEKVWED